MLQHFKNFTCSHLLSDKKIFIKGPLSLFKGDRILITGPSGGGKSTLLALMKGLIPHHIQANLSGTFENFLLAQDAVTIFQNPYSQLVTNNVRDELAFNLENQKVPYTEALNRIEYFTQKMGIYELFKQKRNNFGLSGGECQRLALSSSLSIHPKLLLLDEPTAFLDPESRRMFYQDLFAKTQMSIVLVDHHIDEVKPYVNRIWYCDKEGSITERTEVSDEIISSPINISLPKTQKTNLVVKNFSLNNGDFLFITGKNGCGKTTFLKQLALDLKEQASLAFQNPETHFCFDSIKQELLHDNKILDLKELLTFCKWIGLSASDIERSPFLLSEGEKRRLTLLMCLLQNKNIFLLDEPSFGQDHNNRFKIFQILSAGHKQGKIQVIVTHDESLIKLIEGKYPKHFYSYEMRGHS